MQGPRQYNAVEDFVDRNVEQGFGDKTAFVDFRRTLTYQELQTATYRMANLLGALHIKREARVAMIMLDTVEFPIVFFGSLRAGVIPVCLNTLLPTEQYEYMLSDSRVEALFVSAALLPVVAPIFAQLEFLHHVVVIDREFPIFGEHHDTRCSELLCNGNNSKHGGGLEWDAQL